jgi:hypothetical protein
LGDLYLLYPDKYFNKILDKDWKTAYMLNLCGDYNKKSYRGRASFSVSGKQAGAFLNSKIADGNWHFLVGSYNSNIVNLYIDGRLIRSNKREKSTELPNNNFDLMIGNSAVPERNWNTPFDGLIDEVRLYDRALSDKDIQKLYRLK